MPNKHQEPAVEHILKKYGINPRTITEIAPWGDPHYFSVFTALCPNIDRYVAVDADWDAGLGKNMWERYCRRIGEGGPPNTKLKFRQMLGEGKFEKVAGWYFATGDLPSDLVFYNNALYWSFPALNLAKGLRDIRARGLILIKDSTIYDENTVDFLEAMKSLNFDIGIYLIDASLHREYVFEEVKDLNLRQWSEDMKKWLDSSSKDFFIALKNRDGEIPPRDCLRLTYRAWSDGLAAGSSIRRKDITDSFKEFGRDYLLRSLEESGFSESLHVKNILQSFL